MNQFVTPSSSMQSLHGGAAILHPNCSCCAFCVDDVNASASSNVHRYDSAQSVRQNMNGRSGLMPRYHSSTDYCLQCVSSPCHTDTTYRGVVAGECREGAPVMVHPCVNQGIFD